MSDGALGLEPRDEKRLDLSALDRSTAGILQYQLLPIRRRTVLANMRHVFGGQMNEREIRLLAQSFYTHFMRSAFEYASLNWVSQNKLAGMVDMIGLEHLFAADDAGKGALILTGHFGNWEYAAIAAYRRFESYRGRLHVIRKPLAPVLEQLVLRRFHTAGFRIIPKVNALGLAMDALAANDAVIYVMDQHAPKGSKAVKVDFFGTPAGTNRSLALLAGHTGAPVIPATCYRKPDGRHVMQFLEPLEWIASEDPEEEVFLNTRRYNEVLERFVLDHPDQWLWMHNRWKLPGHRVAFGRIEH